MMRKKWDKSKVSVSLFCLLASFICSAADKIPQTGMLGASVASEIKAGVKTGPPMAGVATPPFIMLREKLAKARQTTPDNAKFDAYKALIKEAGKDQDSKKEFYKELQDLVALRKPEQISKLGELLNYTAYDRQFIDMAPRLRSLLEKSRTPISFTERVDKLRSQLGQASVSPQMKAELLRGQDTLFGELKSLYMERAGKTESDLQALQRLFGTAKYVLTKAAYLDEIKLWDATKAVLPQELGNYVFDRIKTGWATASPINQKSSIDSLGILVIDLKKPENKDLEIAGLTDIFNSIQFGPFLPEYKSQAEQWQKELAALKPAAPVVQISKTYVGILDMAFSKAFDDETFASKPSIDAYLKNIEWLVAKKLQASAQEREKLKNLLELVSTKDELPEPERIKVTGWGAQISAKLSYVERIADLSARLGKIARNPEAKPQYLADLQKLANDMIEEKKAGKEVAQEGQFLNLLNFVKITLAADAPQIELIAKTLDATLSKEEVDKKAAQEAAKIATQEVKTEKPRSRGRGRARR